MRGRDVAKELTARKNITKEFTIVFFETKNNVNRNSKLAGPSRKCIEMIKLAHEDHSYRLSREEFKRYQGQWYLTLNKSGKKCTDATSNPTSELQSQSRTVSIENQTKNVQNPFLTQQYRRWHPSSTSDSWWNWDTSKSWWSSWVQFIF